MQPIGSNKVSQDKVIVQNQESTEKTKETHRYFKDIENDLKQIFQKYNTTYSFDNLLKLLGKDYTKEKVLSLSDMHLDSLINAVNHAFEAVNIKESTQSQQNTVEISGLTIENFKELTAKEYSKNYKKSDFKDLPESFIKEQFVTLIGKMSDDEKAAKSSYIITEFKDKPQLISAFLGSFKDKTKAAHCADNTDSKLLMQDGYKDAATVVFKYMSVPGTQKFFADYENKVYEYYHKNQSVIDRVYKEKTPIETLSPEEQKIINEYDRLVGIGINLSQSVLCNDNFTQEDKENFIKETNTFFENTFCYQKYLESIANFISENKNLNIDKEKLEKVLNEVSDNKYSEIAEKLPEKNAIDSETGSFKTTDTQIISKAEQKIEAIKEEIALNTPKEKTLPQIERNTKIETPSMKLQNGICSFEVIKDIIIGKTKTQSKAEENDAIESYKLLNSAMQGNLLQASTGKFFNKLIDNTKTSTLKNLIEIGWKGRSFASTKQVKETIEERKDDVA